MEYLYEKTMQDTHIICTEGEKTALEALKVYNNSHKENLHCICTYIIIRDTVLYM